MMRRFASPALPSPSLSSSFRGRSTKTIAAAAPPAVSVMKKTLQIRSSRCNPSRMNETCHTPRTYYTSNLLFLRASAPDDIPTKEEIKQPRQDEIDLDAQLGDSRWIALHEGLEIARKMDKAFSSIDDELYFYFGYPRFERFSFSVPPSLMLPSSSNASSSSKTKAKKSSSRSSSSSTTTAAAWTLEDALIASHYADATKKKESQDDGDEDGGSSSRRRLKRNKILETGLETSTIDEFFSAVEERHDEDRYQADEDGEKKEWQKGAKLIQRAKTKIENEIPDFQAIKWASGDDGNCDATLDVLYVEDHKHGVIYGLYIQKNW